MVENSLNESAYLNTKCGFGIMLLVVGLFHLIRWSVSCCCIPIFIKNKGNDEIWKWSNLLISWIHALIVGTWDLLCFYYYPELLNDLVGFKNTFCYYLVVFSTGYFVYDFGDMICNGKVFKMWELTLHHVAVTSMFFYNMVTLNCIAYNVVALLCEVNSFFLHTRKLLQMLQFPFTHPVYRAVAIVNIISFALFRGYSLIRITYGMYMENLKVDAVYFYCLCGSMFIMDLLNPVLFWILLKNDFLRGSKSTNKVRKGTTAAGLSNGSVSTANGDGGSHKLMNKVNNKSSSSSSSSNDSNDESSVLTFKERARKLTNSLNIDEYKIE